MLFNWYHPQQLLTPIACFPKGFPVEQAAITVIEEKPVRFTINHRLILVRIKVTFRDLHLDAK